MNLARHVHLHAKNHPNRPAIIDVLRHRELSWAELDDGAARTATCLHRHGIGAGDRVGTSLRNEMYTSVLALALWRLDAIWIPLNPGCTRVEQNQIAGQFQPRFVVTEPGRKNTADLPLIVHDESWQTAVAGADRWDEFSDGKNIPAIITLSSGTTGGPKGYVYTHENHYAMYLNYWLDDRVEVNDRCLSVLPIAFAAGRGMFLSSMILGVTIVVIPVLSTPQEIIDAAKNHRISVICLVPSIIRTLLEYAAKRPADEWPVFKEIRSLISIGAKLHEQEARLVRERLTPNLIDLYGSAGGGITTSLKGGDLVRKPGSVGYPVNGVEVEIVDNQHHALPPGSCGRLRCRGACVAAAYAGTEEVADEEFRDAWHYPGDYGYLDKDGYLYIQGRRGEIIIREGFNIFAPEIEGVLTAHPAILDAAVVGVPTAVSDEEVVAFVVGAAEIDDRELRAHCRTLIAPYKIPGRFIRVDVLPRSDTGKVLKRLLVDDHSRDAD